MKWIYIDKNKGKFFSIVAGLLIAILIGIRITITILYSLNLIPNIFNNFQIIICGFSLNFDQFIIISIFFGLYIVMDGFFEGIPASLFEISIILLFFFFILQGGKLIFVLLIPFSTATFTLDLSILFLIVLIVYIGILIFEIYIFWLKTVHKEDIEKDKKVSKGKTEKENEEIYAKKKNIVKVDKKRPSKTMFAFNLLTRDEKWVDPKEGTLYFEDDEYALLQSWKKVEGEYKESFFQFFVLNILILLGTGFIYGLLRFIIQDVPAEGNYYNYFLTGLFFPVYTILITSFLSIRHFIRAVLFLFGILSVTLLFWEMDLITVNGTFIFSKIIAFLNILFIDLAPYFNQLTRQDLYNLYIFIIGIVIQIQFFLLIITSFIGYLRRRGSEMDIFSSNLYLYIRDTNLYNTWMLIFEFLSVALWPFNPNKWRSLYNKLRFKLQSIREGTDFNYGRLSYLKTIKKMKKIRPSLWKLILKLGLLIFFFAFTIPYFFGYIFLIIILVEIWRFRKNRDKITIKAKYERKKAQGSIFLFGNTNVIYLYRLSKKTGALIPSVQSYK